VYISQFVKESLSNSKKAFFHKNSKKYLNSQTVNAPQSLATEQQPQQTTSRRSVSALQAPVDRAQERIPRDRTSTSPFQHLLQPPRVATHPESCSGIAGRTRPSLFDRQTRHTRCVYFRTPWRRIALRYRRFLQPPLAPRQPRT